MAFFVGCAAFALIPSAASAQLRDYSPKYGATSAWDSMQPVDPGFSDLGPLGVQTRLLATELRQDRDFGILYRGIAADGTPWFARRDAGITAIFPRSAYAQSASGEVALIPPDTTFIIGEPAMSFSDSFGLSLPDAGYRDPSNGLRLDGRLGTRMDQTRDVTRPWLERQSPPSPRRGIRALLLDAGQRERTARARDH